MLLLRKKIKVIIDTNLWISFLISWEFEQLDFLFSSGKILLLFSNRLLSEFLRVASREKFRKFFSTSEIDELSAKLKRVAKMIETKSILTLCRDPKDNFLLELAVDGKADYIVTGDKDLLELKTIGITQIVTIKEFQSIIVQ